MSLLPYRVPYTMIPHRTRGTKYQVVPGDCTRGILVQLPTVNTETYNEICCLAWGTYATSVRDDTSSLFWPTQLSPCHVVLLRTAVAICNTSTVVVHNRSLFSLLRATSSSFFLLVFITFYFTFQPNHS